MFWALMRLLDPSCCSAAQSSDSVLAGADFVSSIAIAACQRGPKLLSSPGAFWWPLEHWNRWKPHGRNRRCARLRLWISAPSRSYVCAENASLSIQVRPFVGSHSQAASGRGLLHGRVTEVHHDQTALVVFRPAPGQQVHEAWIIRPACPLTQFPPAVVEERVVDGFQKLAIKTPQLSIGSFRGPSAQENR